MARQKFSRTLQQIVFATSKHKDVTQDIWVSTDGLFCQNYKKSSGVAEKLRDASQNRDI